MSIRTLLKQIAGLNIFVRLSRGLYEAPFKKEPLYLEISLSTIDIRTNFSLALEKVGSHMRGFTVSSVQHHDSFGLTYSVNPLSIYPYSVL